jgi:dUTPase
MAKPRRKLLQDGTYAPTVDLYMPEEVVIGPSEEVLVDLSIRIKFPPGVVGLLGLRRKTERAHRIRINANVIGRDSLVCKHLSTPHLTAFTNGRTDF